MVLVAPRSRVRRISQRPPVGVGVRHSRRPPSRPSAAPGLRRGRAVRAVPGGGSGGGGWLWQLVVTVTVAAAVVAAGLAVGVELDSGDRVDGGSGEVVPYGP
ncbi:hypothetical protein [Saccharomonospora sp. NB11]|jgi:hypothetical protein|uniref:hypothetical protein n=1 Tax=Saccharomonospora sp. NB11 TaxID=1642298 RepID=UPI0018D0B822|nr:hypothetical protein [Saccharomonospora sp. NB11]